MGIDVTIEGVPELTAKLRSLGADVSKHLEAAGTKGMLVLEAEIKRRAPVKTGNLRDSYSTEAATAGDTVTVTTGTNVVYARPQEYGPRPHVRPAIDAVEGNVGKVVRAELKSALAGMG
ncbi:MAG TPA: HK97 gp10 family phage protein [Methanoregulaceae archaeon]|jgi:HK97 gp10 family phage protein|nr:HK97 gp10 family phage protein [Methanoregulaceae archaeon]